VDEAVTAAYQMAFAREPTQSEILNCAAFVQQQQAVYLQQKTPAPRRSALTDLCQALMSASEFIYIE
jgi:hypothetical protein